MKNKLIKYERKKKQDKEVEKEGKWKRELELFKKRVG